MNTPAVPVEVRAARPEDVPDVVALIRELAEYERARDEVHATEELLHEALFAVDAATYCEVAERNGEIIGFAVWFLNFSTWLGRSGIYLEDLYVRPEARGTGVGTALLRHLAALCVERDYRRLDWAVLEWNEPSRKFYESLGAEALTDWVPYRLTGPALQRLGGHGSTGPGAP